MVEINPEWIQQSPDDLLGLTTSDLLVQAAVVYREYRDMMIALHSQNVLIDKDRFDALERLVESFTVAIRSREPEVLVELDRLNVPVNNLRAAPGLCACLYENRVRRNEPSKGTE